MVDTQLLCENRDLKQQLAAAQAEVARLTADHCDHCGAELNVLGCGTCGAPVCCPSCRRVATLEQQLAAAQATITGYRNTVDIYTEQFKHLESRTARLRELLAEAMKYIGHGRRCKYTAGFGPPDTDICTCRVHELRQQSQQALAEKP